MNYEQLYSFYNNLADEESKIIFNYRMKYFFTRSKNDILEMVKTINRSFHPERTFQGVYNHLPDNLKKAKNYILYGAGGDSETYFNLFAEHMPGESKVIAFCDSDDDKVNNSKGLHFGIPLITRKMLLEDKKIQGLRHNNNDEKVLRGNKRMADNKRYITG